MSVDYSKYSLEEVGRIGEEIYRRDIRPKVMPQEKGKFLIIDIESGDYEIGEDDLETEHRLRARQPDNVFFGMRVGYKSAYKLSGSMAEESEE